MLNVFVRGYDQNIKNTNKGLRNKSVSELTQ